MAWREMTAAKPVDETPKALVFEVKDGVLRSNMSVREIIEMNRRKRAADD